MGLRVIGTYGSLWELALYGERPPSPSANLDSRSFVLGESEWFEVVSVFGFAMGRLVSGELRLRVVLFGLGVSPRCDSCSVCRGGTISSGKVNETVMK